MLELKRILKTYSKTILLTLLVVLNIFTFLYYENDKYIDSKTYSSVMTSEFSKIKDMNLEQSINYLENQKKYYELENELTQYIKNLDSDGAVFNDPEVIEFYNKNLDLVKKIRDKSIDTKKEKIKEIVNLKLLEQTTHIRDYDEFLNSIESNKEDLLTFSIFNKKGTFSYKNILKTAEDYKELKNIKLELGNYLAIEDISNYEYINIFIALTIIIIVFSFIDDRKKGMKELINSTKNGRIKLTINRIIALLVSSFGSCLILYGTIFILALFIHGGASEFNNIIISVPLFSKFTLAINIWQYIGIFIITKILSTFLIGMIIWYVISKIKNKSLGFMILLIFFGIEYILYRNIDFNSYISILKVINIFPMVFLNNSFIEYVNINLFGNPVSYLTTIFIVLTTAIIIFLALHIFKSYYEKNYHFILVDKMISKVKKFNDLIINKFTLQMYEVYKNLVLQKGWIILFVFIYVMVGFNYLGHREEPLSMEEQVAMVYAKEFEGVINNDMISKIENLEKEFSKTLEELKDKERDYKNGKLNYYEFYTYKAESEQAEIHLRGLEILKNKVLKLTEESEDKNIKLWLLDEEHYDNAYGNNSKEKQKTALCISILVLTLLFANSFTFENESNIKMLLNTTKNKKRITRAKYISAFGLTIAIWLIIAILSFKQFIVGVNTSTLVAPVQSLEVFRFIPLKIDIKTFICLLYLIKLALMLIVTNIILYISSRSKKTVNSYVISLLVAISLIVVIFILRI